MAIGVLIESLLGDPAVSTTTTTHQVIPVAVIEKVLELESGYKKQIESLQLLSKLADKALVAVPES